MAKPVKLSPFRLATLLRREADPLVALRLFQNPNRNPTPFRRSALAYDLIICKLGRARMFQEMESILDEMHQEKRFVPKEALFRQVISFYGRAGMPDAALSAYLRIRSFRCSRTPSSLAAVLNVFRRSGASSARLRELCRELEHDTSRDASVYNVLIGGCMSLSDAFALFDEMLSKGSRPTVVTFGTLISALLDNSKVDEAFKLKREMLKAYGIQPNAQIYTSLIKALCQKGDLERAIKLKDEMLLNRDMETDSAVYSTLIRGMFKAGKKGEVVGILEEMKRSGIKADTVVYNAMIAGFCEEREFDAAFEALDEMGRNGCRADVVSYNTIIAGFRKAGRWKEAKELFDDMPRRECRPDVVSYRMVFDGLSESKELEEAVVLLDEMVFKGYMPAKQSLRMFVERMNVSGNLVSALPAICGLAKGNAVTLDVWEMMVGGMLKELELVAAVERLDHLRKEGLASCPGLVSLLSCSSMTMDQCNGDPKC